MQLEHIKKEDIQTKEWSGGTTTELAIYPKEATYSERNFAFRLSSAKVEMKESVFTSLPGIIRKIMVLEGKMELEHEGHHSKVLEQFDTDEFMGDWKTYCKGKVTDFNLMTSGNTTGTIKGSYLHPQSAKEISLYSKHKEIWACYVHKGKVNYDIRNNIGILKRGDLLLIHHQDEKIQLHLQTEKESELVFCEIELLD